ncbi:pyridoxamine phosphate oxidase family protein [Stemphylium lycopersici]|uniref:Pyridoxamine phosphate oxidase family protein n=1 Tax=Stemphylium lycopersici TaxID=183478 RepID=A0A364MZN0_STELY|nr:pyridoxamine phosphate oxidase family protein [Stemphylium lycopersici]RAQ99713.1 pyridoxamine phosphate oxidase family protein [Stemphylium lycopersici]RAR08048.1 pyridoxamine phosphate oxidase family protein [Stemphylium lycopersici]
MVKFYPSLNEDHIDFITNQPLFFVASAPWAGEHINISPKGHPSKTFSVLGPNTVAYLDATGSGCETISHVYENGRVTVMFSSFGKSPQIMRLFCKGRVVEKWDPYFGQIRAKMSTENGDDVDIAGVRAIIVLRIQKVQTSCGFGVPQVGNGKTESTEAEGDAIAYANHEPETEESNGFKDRETMEKWAHKMMEKQELSDYQKQFNHRSLDGLPGMMSVRRAYDENIAVEDTKAWLRKVNRQRDAVALGVGLGVVLMLLLSLVGVLSIKPIFLQRILNFQQRQMGIPEDLSWKSEL